MKSRLKIMTMFLLIFAPQLFLCSCSGSDEEYDESSSLEEQQHEIAQEGVEMIQTPIDKAQKAQGISDIRNQKTEEEIENQQ